MKGKVCDLDESAVVNIGVEVGMEPGQAVAVLEGIHSTWTYFLHSVAYHPEGMFDSHLVGVAAEEAAVACHHILVSPSSGYVHSLLVGRRMSSSFEIDQAAQSQIYLRKRHLDDYCQSRIRWDGHRWPDPAGSLP